MNPLQISIGSQPVIIPLPKNQRKYTHQKETTSIPPLPPILTGREAVNLLKNLNMEIKNNIEDFASVLDIFKKAYRIGPDPYTYSSFITAADIAGEFVEAMQKFDLARMSGKANVFVYNTFIKAAGHAKEFLKAKDAFNEVFRLGIADAYTCGIYITAADDADRFDEALRAFDDAVNKEIMNVGMCNALIRAARKVGNFLAAERAFTIACRLGADETTYSSFIQVAGNTENFPKAEEAFELAKIRGKANAYVYNTYMKAARDDGPFLKVHEIFCQAMSNGMFDRVTYILYMIAAGNANHCQGLDWAYQNALSKGIDGPAFFEAYRKAKAKVEEFLQIETTDTTQTDEFLQAEKVLNEAIDRDQVGATEHNAFVAAAIRAGRLREPQEWSIPPLQRNISAGTAMASIPFPFKHHIEKAGEKGNFDQATRMYALALTYGPIDSTICAAYIRVAIYTGNVQSAKWAFEWAQRTGRADKTVCDAYRQAAFIQP